MNTLQKHGLQRFDPGEATEDGKTQKFDPKIHEATFMTKAEGKEDGDIMYTQSKGFTLNGRILRVSSQYINCYYNIRMLTLLFRLPRLVL
jgi:molecular chaperone GrpE